jgi:hypothetical protein
VRSRSIVLEPVREIAARLEPECRAEASDEPALELEDLGHLLVGEHELEHVEVLFESFSASCYRNS